MKQDYPPSASLLTWSQHVLSPSGLRTHGWPTDGTTSVMFPFTGTEKLGHLG